MRKAMVKTSNVRHFAEAMNRIMKRPDELPGMALVFGEPGLGKTRTCLWWAAANDGIFVRTKKLMSGRWLLEEIVAELGEAPANKISSLFRQAQDQLLEKPRPLFVDEVDYLDGKVIETLRDLHDITGNPIIFIGMDHADRKLARYKHLYDRFSEVVKFSHLTREDVRATAEELCEVKLSDDAISFIHNNTNRFRRVVVWLYKCESIARGSSLKEVTAAHLQGVKK